MSCMCGDTHCSSCGPAQGNWKCPICGSWADDGCEHFDEESGLLKPEFNEEANRIWLEENQADDAYIQSLSDEETFTGDAEREAKERK